MKSCPCVTAGKSGSSWAPSVLLIRQINSLLGRNTGLTYLAYHPLMFGLERPGVIALSLVCANLIVPREQSHRVFNMSALLMHLTPHHINDIPQQSSCKLVRHQKIDSSVQLASSGWPNM